MPNEIDVADDFDDEEGDDWDEENNELLYLKYQFEGCSSIDELSGRLRGLVEYLNCLRLDGWRLERPVEGGHAHLLRGDV